jgi:hypothetical protein
MSTTPKIAHGIDSQLTVANGTNPVTLLTITIPSPTGAVDGISVLINGNHTGGPNDSFKNHAAAGSYLEAWVDIQPADDANWRRLTPSNTTYQLQKAAVNDILALSNVAGAVMYRVRCSLSAAPDDDVDLDFMFLFETDQKH